MKILRNIEQSDNLDPHHHDVSKMFAQPGHAEPLMGQEEEIGETIGDDEEDWGNSVSGASGHHTHGVDAVTFSGDDMNSKGKSSPLQRAPGTNTLREPTQVSEELVSRLTQMYQAIKEDFGQSVVTVNNVPAGNSANGTPKPSQIKAIDPVRDAKVDQKTQMISPQANFPGLAPGGDPELWKLQNGLRKKGYKLKTDGLNGPETEKMARDAGLLHDIHQDVANPSAVDIGGGIGQTLGKPIGWIETAWRNLQKEFKNAQQGINESAELNDMLKIAGLK